MQIKTEHHSLPLRVDCGSKDILKEVAVSANGITLACTVGPMTKRAVARLDDALYANEPVELVFDSSSLCLQLRSLESSDPHTVRIVGRLVSQPSAGAALH